MANPKKRLPSNVAGNFFVDSTCINCDTCRQLAPETFDESDDEYSFVYSQPTTPVEERRGLRALLACPTGSIGTIATNRAREILADFPLRIDGEVFYCGFTSPHSFGASSYFIRHPEGNWLIDSPKFLPHLVDRFDAMGGLSFIFLTHRDDVADADRFGRHFGAQRIIHREELTAQPDAEVVLDGMAPIRFLPHFVVIPTPGHTEGHCTLLYSENDRSMLFSGDHLWWSRAWKRLHASESVCWFDWDEQRRSLERLLHYEFEWLLPGHGQRHHTSVANMRQELRQLLRRLEAKERVSTNNSAGSEIR